MLVVAVVEARAACAHDAIEAAGDARKKVAKAIAHRAAVVGLDDEMNVIVLNREVHHPKPAAALRTAERICYGPEAPLTA